jgi:hypothetical protein
VCSNPDAPAGTTCDDGMYCTLTDSCDGARACVGTGSPCNDMMTCTDDVCDEATDMCSFPPTMGCVIAGECVATGATNPGFSCQVCDPALSMTAYSPLPAGSMCGLPRCTMGRLTTRTCNMAGSCVMAPAVPCPTGVCLDMMACEPGCMPGDCAAGEWCNPTTTICETLGTAGATCTLAEGCASGMCTDGVCCDAPCDGTCESCSLGGTAGTCTPITAGTDPDAECAPTTCDGAGGCTLPDAGPTDTDAGSDLDGGPATDGGAGRVDSGPRPRGGRRSSSGCCSVASQRSTPPTGLLLLGLAIALAIVARKKV